MDTASDQRTPPVVFGIVIANAAVFGIGGLSPVLDQWLNSAMLWPLNGPFAPWQLLSYAFLHGGFLHLAVNMLMIWMFGGTIERTLQSGPFLIYYLVCVVGAAALHLVVGAWTGSIYPTVGASGGVFGILLAFGLLYPNQMVMLLIPPIPMKAKWLVIALGAFTLWAGVSGRMAGIAHFAHLGGMLFGLVLLQYWRGRLPIKPRRQLML